MTQAIIADDLTGAGDAGVQFATRGRRVTVWLDAGAIDTASGSLLVIDTDSRFVDPATAHARVTRVLRALRPAQPRDVVKKIDSTLRGNIAAEVRALLEALPGATAIVVPAYPKNGRTTRNGVQYVGGTPVDRSDVGRDLFSPVADARVAAHLDAPAAGIPLAAVRDGSLSTAIDICRRDGARAVVPDAETDDDLRAIAAVAGERHDLVWCGSAGIIEYLAGTAPVPIAATVPPAFGPVVFIIGSLSTMTAAQIRDFAADGAVALVEPLALLRGGRSIALALAPVRTALRAGSDVLIATTPNRDLAETALAYGRTRGWTTRATSDHIRRALVAATREFIAPAATTVLSGGDVARAFCEAHAIRGMELVAEAAPGVPVARAIGADAHLVTKAGGFGTPHTYRTIQAALHRKVTA